MKQVHDLIQGSDEWLRFRAEHFGASECAAMLGLSKKMTRNELLHLKHTGLGKEFSEWVQKNILDYGHDVEAMALPNIEAIFGVELFKATCSDGDLSASCDGLTIDNTTAFEHKQWAEDLAAQVAAGVVPDEHMPQCQQIMLVTGAEKVIFAVSDGTTEKLVYTEVLPDPAWFARIKAGWKQFKDDLAVYVPEPAKATPVAAKIEGFGALSMRVEGRVLASNLDTFRAGAEAFIARLPKPEELQTDQDFADAEAAVKTCAEAESRIKAAKDAALAQMADVDAVMRAADTIAETIRAARLSLDKAVKAEKENRRSELIRSGIDAVREHYASINATLAGYELGVPASLPGDMGAAIKGLKSLDSIRDKIGTAVANAKIGASQEAERRRACIALLPDDRSLFPDSRELVASKHPDDLRNLIAARIAENQQREQARLDAERARIRAEEEAKAKAEAERLAEEERERIRREEMDEQAAKPKEVVGVQQTLLAPDGVMARSEEPPKYDVPDDGARIRLGELNSIIHPLSISADGLSHLGFDYVATDKAAKLYRKSDLPRILARMAQHIVDAVAEYTTP
jgi:predicted phage-related endonuclease